MNEIREGYICPICLADLRDINQLQIHFSENHDNVEDKQFIGQIKGMFGKAKQILMKPETGGSPHSNVSPKSQERFSPFLSVEQEIGVVRSHSSMFKNERESTINDFAVKTNKLIIRLDKLVNQAPEDPALRKEFEKSVIPWEPDRDQSECSICHSRFSLTKRRHHCRLCGRIICNVHCSRFLTFAFARKLTNPAFAASYGQETDAATTGDKSNVASTSAGASAASPQPSMSLFASIASSPGRLLSTVKADRLLKKGVSALKRDGSEVSLSSFLNQEGEDHLRMCKICKELLERWDSQVEARTQPPIVVQMYDRLCKHLEEASLVFPSYCDMAQSLNAGESLYNLQTAKELRLKMLKLAEQIDFMSKKIAALGSDDPDKIPLGISQVQQNIRRRSLYFLQELTIGLPNLPDEQNYAALQEKNKSKLMSKIEAERSYAHMAEAKISQLHSVYQKQMSLPAALSSPKLGEQISHDSGWNVDSKMFFEVEDQELIDPLRQQVGIIKGFIRQAAGAGKLEEVRMLESNLRELEKEVASQMTISCASSQHLPVK